MLDELFYKQNNQRDFFVCGTYAPKKFSKWKTYLNSVAIIDVLNLENNNWKDLKYFEQINNRSIFPHEIVLDIEEPEQLKPIIEKIKEHLVNFSVFETGSRGYHIHIYFDRDMSIIEKENVVKLLGTDIQKCSEKNLIALENTEHWKGTGKIKREIEI